jgi:hypothetical protein
MWSEAQRLERERLWPGVQELLSGLPPSLSGQVKLLEYDLALRYSPSGQFRDIFLGPDQFPLLSIASWLMEDLALETGNKRERAERRLFRAAFLVAARTHAMRSVLDATSFYDSEQVALLQFLSERSVAELSRIVPPGSRSWEAQEAIALDGLEEMLVQRQIPLASLALDGPEACLNARWSSPGKTLALATLTVGRRLDAAPLVNVLLDEVASAFEIKSDLLSIHADLLAGRPTYPIAFVARAAGLSLDPWPDATLVLGALVATGSADSMIDAAISRLREGRQLAVDLGLATFAEYLLDVAAGLEERRPRLAHHRGTSADAGAGAASPPPLIVLAQPTVPKALEMAEGFLLADPTFRESWESHREGMFGSREVASHFPAGLILEVLSAQGLQVSTHIDAFLAFTWGNQFRYYDHPMSHIDSDTLGVYLRLIPRAASAGEGQAPAPVLACLERDVAAMGRVPVWIKNCEGSPRDRPYMLDLGEGCGTVAAHLLLGLLMHAPDRYGATIERGSLHLLEQIGDAGLRANVNYPPAFALAVFGRLIAGLEASTVGFFRGRAKRAVDKAMGVLALELDRAIARSVRTPQQAALLTTACLQMKRSEKVDPSWRTTILKGQSFDGGWIGEPFAAAPNRGNAVTWYSSRLLTSALCYDALKASAVSI